MMTDNEKRVAGAGIALGLAGILLAAFSSKGRARFRGFATRARAGFGRFRGRFRARWGGFRARFKRFRFRRRSRR